MSCFFLGCINLGWDKMQAKYSTPRKTQYSYTFIAVAIATTNFTYPASLPFKLLQQPSDNLTIDPVNIGRRVCCSRGQRQIGKDCNWQTITRRAFMYHYSTYQHYTDKLDVAVESGTLLSREYETDGKGCQRIVFWFIAEEEWERNKQISEEMWTISTSRPSSCSSITRTLTT